MNEYLGVDFTPSGNCANCKDRPAEQYVNDGGIASHWCCFCVTKKQLDYARNIAATIPKLEQKLSLYIY